MPRGCSRSPGRGHARRLGPAAAAPLGIVDGERYPSETVAYASGDILLLVTDGVTEAIERDADPESGALVALTAACRPDVDQLADEVVGAVRDSHQRALPDDVAVLAIELG